MREALYRAGGGAESRYEAEMKGMRSGGGGGGKPAGTRPFEAQSAMIQSMFPSGARGSPRRAEPLLGRQQQQKKQQGRKAGNWFGQDTSWMEDLSMGDKMGKKKPVVPNVMSLDLGEKVSSPDP